MRVRDKDQTRARLIEAGIAVSSDVGLTQMSVAAIVERAHSSKGAFFHHFPDRDSFVVALHDDFHDRMAGAMERAIVGRPPGADRLLRAARAYWSFCLRERGMRAMLLEARGHGPVAAAARRRSVEAARTYAQDLASLGVPSAPTVAHLVVAAATEVSLMELEAGKRLGGARSAFGRVVAGL